MIYNPKKPDGKNVFIVATESVQHDPQYLTVEPKPVQGGTYCVTVKTEMSKKELECLLELCQEEKARRQAAKNGGACNEY